MENLSLVLLKSAAWLTGFALVYLLVLRNERYFRLNRFYLLTGIVASLLFPFYTFHYAVVLPSLPFNTASVGELSAGTVVPSETLALPVYFWIYLTGLTIFLFRLLFQTWKIIRKLQKSGYEQTGAVKLVRTSEYLSSFSFFSFVFVNPSTASIEMEEIMNHEQEHIQQRHWFDLLLVELLCIAQWFNPFAWIYAHLVRQNHEYLADESALQRTTDPAIYQATLLNQLLGDRVFSLANSFSYSLNKKRFKMMKKKIDSPFRKLRILLVLPLVAMLFYAFATPDYQYKDDNYGKASDGKVINVKGQVIKSDGTPLYGTSVILRGSTIGTITNPEGKFELKNVPSDGELVFSFVGFKSVVERISGNPMKITMQTAMIGIEEIRVTDQPKKNMPEESPEKITKGISENNTTLPPSSLSGLLRELDGANPPLIFLNGFRSGKKEMARVNQDSIASINVLKGKEAQAMVGEQGKNGIILIVTKAQAGKEIAQSLAYSDKKADQQKVDNVFVVVEEMPEFPGGEQALREFIRLTVKYPRDAVKDNIQGNVYVTFTVNSDGTVGNAKIARGVHPLLDNEAIRVVNQLPLWKPGKQRGVAVNVAYTIPVQFVLSDSKKVDFQEEKTLPQKEKEVFVVVEEMPEFPGGVLSLRKFLANVIIYPAEAKKDKVQGKVFVSFVINGAGKVEQAQITQGIHPALDAEALRVVNLMPLWKPGKQRGQAVSVSYTIPIQFALQ